MVVVAGPVVGEVVVPVVGVDVVGVATPSCC